MKLTALDIHHKEFRRSLRGYSEEDVDGFLDQVADEFDRLFKENIDLAEKIEQANERVRSYQLMESTLNNTLVSAQRSAEEIVNKAGLEADSMLRDAELKAKEIVHGALQKKQQVANELIRIKQAEEQFRESYRSLLQNNLRNIDEVQLPADVNVLLDDGDSSYSTVDVRPSAPAPAPAPQPYFATPAPEPAPEPASAPQPDPVAEEPEPPAAPAWMPPAIGGTSPIFDYAADLEEASSADSSASAAAPVADEPVIEPPASGFVSSIALGETEAPELPSGPVDLIEPGEFELPGFDALGERETDDDIEEID